ncbi:hypothetical protein KC331_g14284 [Hortaea werneckii]|uniref:DUF7905 domain-containing protein n=1 Tax=Hortaea werneckii TaxID=91943 RepID=A0A3M7CPC0_HORWE|nr:hypothetical protein KC331_g14284 [Hortaea werneckii]KAI7704045.1 hypothetical protein KC353_g13737 [Hortaea werneckii]RMY53690.1 hypothetical protein D0865_05120 [Hortaea werneckii]
MADYELSNTAEWDSEYTPATQSDANDGWQEVKKKKSSAPKAGDKPILLLPQLAQDIPSRKSRQQYETRTGRQRRPAAIQPGALPYEWQKEDGVQPPQQQLRPPRFPILDDGAAEAAWRAHKPPVGKVRIPEFLVFSARQHETIARRCGAFVFNRNEESIGGEKIYSIWGDKEAFKRTVREIGAWIKEATSDIRRGAAPKFAKVISQTLEERRRTDRRWRREVQRQTYRQDPPPDKCFEAIGSFHWPIEECRPEEVLGSSYEALDQIRMDCSCHITFHARLGVFRVAGTASQVKAGLQRLLRTCFQITARQVLPVRKYLLRWPHETVPTYLYLEHYEHPASSTSEGMSCTKSGRSPRGEYLEEEARSARAAMETEVNKRRVRNMIISMLGKLYYFRGSIQMRIRLGTLVLKQYKPPRDELYDLDEYERMTDESQFQAEVTQELGDRTTEERLVDHVQHHAGSLLSPLDSALSDLHEVKPTFSADFTFHDSAGNLCLTIEWQEALEHMNSDRVEYVEKERKWTRFERDSGNPTPLLDINLTDLNSGWAWQFDILASQPVDEKKVPETLQKFANSIRIHALSAAKLKGKDPIVLRYTVLSNLINVQERTCYSYVIANSEFNLEISRFQTRIYHPRPPMAAPEDGPRTSFRAGPETYEPRWSLSAYRQAWDTLFNENERLPVGQGVGWKNDMATWFPADIGSEASEKEDVGWSQLMDNLGQIEAMVAKLKVETHEEDEDFVGGMQIA